MANPFPLNLGPLRGAMELTLHTHHAVRIWKGRPAGEGKKGRRASSASTVLSG